jgi:hypothetical protein
MNNYIFIVILVILIPVVVATIRTKSYNVFYRQNLPNRKVQDKVEPFVRQALQENGLGEYNPSEYTEVKFVQESENVKLISVQLFIIKKNALKKWNPVERLIKITGKQEGDEYKIFKLQDSNSKDLGSIIPANSDVPQNTLFRSRRWQNHQNLNKYDEYKKDWDIHWMNKPI